VKVHPRHVGHDVTVTGIGAITPIGATAESTWSAMLAGRSGIAEIQDDWAARLPVRIAARLPVDPADLLDRVLARRTDRGQQMAVVAAREAWADAGAPEVRPERLAVVIGTATGGVQSLLDQDDVLESRGARQVSPHTPVMTMINGSAAFVSLEIGAEGGARTPVSACASGAEAMAVALDLLRFDRADVVVAGGSDACITPITLAGFAQARALSKRNDAPCRASRPFDADRDGFVAGEGAVLFVLERAGFAAARGARRYANLAGAGITSDAHHMTSAHAPGQIRAIRMALRDADLVPTDIDHVHAHATSTPLGDLVEARSIAEAIGVHPAVTSTKSITGHLFGTSGALGALAGVLAMRDGVVPGTQNVDTLDQEVMLDIVTGRPRPGGISAVLTNSFGFGGHNASLVFTP
jgi:3-oxoacyl-[acyl-carrier-protein] synthase II